MDRLEDHRRTTATARTGRRPGAQARPKPKIVRKPKKGEKDDVEAEVVSVTRAYTAAIQSTLQSITVINVKYITVLL